MDGGHGRPGAIRTNRAISGSRIESMSKLGSPAASRASIDFGSCEGSCTWGAASLPGAPRERCGCGCFATWSATCTIGCQIADAQGSEGREMLGILQRRREDDVDFDYVIAAFEVAV